METRRLPLLWSHWASQMLPCSAWQGWGASPKGPRELWEHTCVRVWRTGALPLTMCLVCP